MKPIYAILIMLFVSCCKEEGQPCFDITNPDCENFDPCHAKRANADFTISQYKGWVIEKGYEPEFCDTILGAPNGNGGAEFIALMPGALEYYYKIGTDVRKFSGQQLKLLFSDYTKDTANNLQPNNPLWYKPIPVTLYIRNNLSSCIPASDTLISKTRNLVFTRKNIKRGKFRGRFDVDGKERDIEITEQWVTEPWGAPCYLGYYFLNFPFDDSLKICGDFAGANGKLGSYKQWQWNLNVDYHIEELDGINDFHLHVEPKADGRDEISLEYTHVLKGSNEFKKITFKGKRIL